LFPEVYDRGQRATFDELHDEPRSWGIRVNCVHRDNVVVDQQRGDAGFFEETLAGVAPSGCLVLQNFDGNGAVEAELVVFPDGTHASATDQFDHLQVRACFRRLWCGRLLAGNFYQSSDCFEKWQEVFGEVWVSAGVFGRCRLFTVTEAFFELFSNLIQQQVL
jgi:hypothetical protein